jgi:hypothetical protein
MRAFSRPVVSFAVPRFSEHHGRDSLMHRVIARPLEMALTLNLETNVVGGASVT